MIIRNVLPVVALAGSLAATPVPAQQADGLAGAAAAYTGFIESMAAGQGAVPDASALAAGWSASAALWALDAPGFRATAEATALLGPDVAAESILTSPIAAPTAGYVETAVLEDISVLRLAAERLREPLLQGGPAAGEAPPADAGPGDPAVLPNTRPPDIESLPLAPVRGAFLRELRGAFGVSDARAANFSPALARVLALAAGSVAGADDGWIAARAADPALRSCLHRAALNQRQCAAASANDAERQYCGALYAADGVADCLLAGMN